MIWCGKASAPDNFWPDYFDHLKSELNPCNIVLYVKDNLTGRMWSCSPVFAIRLY